MDSFDVNPVVNFGGGISYRRSDSLCCGAIALAPGDTAAQDTIYVGTGEPHTGTGDILGIGPLVSKDGGSTWVQEPVVRPAGGASLNLNGFGFFALAVDPANPNWVVGAMNAGIVTREPLGGGAFQWVFRQPDAALTATISNLSMSSVVVARAGGVTTFFAAAHGNQRNNANNATTTRNIYSSTDGGQNWNRLGNQLPANQGRVTLAVRRSDPTIVYAFASTGRVFRFEQGDNRWRSVNGLPQAGQLVGTGDENQGWYDLAIAVAPNNPNLIFLGGSTAASNAAGRILPTAASDEQWGGAIWRCELTVTKSGATVTNINIPAARRNFIGGSCHADIHALVFGKTQTGDDDPSQLWVGCDGGVYHSNTPTANGLIFQAKNNGLQTLMMHHMGLHPTEDSIMFCGTQDNGGLLFTGVESWVHSTAGDCGYGLIKSDNQSLILSTYTGESLNRSTNGGVTYPNPGLVGRTVTLATGETVEFYAPLAVAPDNPNRVAFGTRRLRISDNFGNTWPQDLQHRSSGFLDSNSTSLAFANANRVYVGTTMGSVYRFDRNAGNGRWDMTRLYDPTAATPPTAWPNALAVNDIAVDPTNPSLIFITLEATGAHPHVWHCDSSVAPPVWTARSGPAPGGANSLPNVHHSAIAIDTENFTAPSVANPNPPQHIYVGTDIGIWKSSDGGANWQRYSDGLPDVAVLDLKILPSRTNANPPNNLLRSAILYASTHGRGVWQRHLVVNELAGFPPVELFIRRTDLDTGRHQILEGLNNINGTAVNVEKSPGIKLDAPGVAGTYQLPQSIGEAIDFVQFTTQLADSGQAATEDTEVRTRVYVQVHNRGVMPANDVRVTLLYANKTTGIPALPAGYDANIRNGVAINTPDWKTVGSVVLHNVRVGFPKIAAFELSSTLLPAPASLPPLPADDFMLLALVHHADDPYNSNNTDTRANTLADRKTAMKTFQISQHLGAMPALIASRPPLNGFVALPPTATTALQPFDSILADALRVNDDFLKKSIEAALAAPMAGRVHDINVLTNPSVREIVMAEEINLTSAVSPNPKVPLVWFARTKITLRNSINAVGKGAPQTEAGDFGGSGGGGSTGGNPCNLPLIGTTLSAGGATGTGSGNALDPDWATRALLYPAACKGGAGGGGANGGAGGGVVILCAPVIEFAAGGQIDASGQAATGANSGGGGGGLIVLIAGEIIGLKEAPDAAANALVTGGAGNGGGNGGNGLVLKKIYN